MKSTYLIVLGVIIVIGSVVLLNMKPKEVVAPVQTEEKTITVTPTPTSTATEHGMTAEEHAAMMGEATAGTDVGMEMPETPVSQGAPTNTNTAKTFMIDGTNFAFDVKEMRVKEGDTVTIHFMSADGFHDLVIDEFNVRTEKLKTGGMAMITFVASKKGTFEYYCSVGSHRANGMIGKLVVE